MNGVWDNAIDPVSNLPSDRGERALALRNGLMSQATGGSIDAAVYRTLRAELMADVFTEKFTPKFLRTCPDPGDFWEFIKYEFSTYRERRDYLRAQFQPLISYLETNTAPAADYISLALEKFDVEGVAAAWSKALKRSADDPEGAITAARTLIETVCKHILDEGVVPGSAYGSGDDLPKLYHQVSTLLNIAPSQYSEGVLKQILGGCSSDVTGLGALRNRIGDAHGQGKRRVRVHGRHAALAVNLAGAMASFLVETHAHKSTET